MTSEIAFVFGLIFVAAALMASNKVRFDIVALLVVIALPISGVLSAGEAIAGFGSSVVLIVAGLLVVGEMLDRTGVARAVGELILKRGGKSETRLLILIMISAAVLSGVMSSTAVVAIFIPVVLRIAAETNISRSRLLIPMSYAALISGMLTLIATPPNIVVSEELKNAGLEGFGFFTFTVVGAVVLVVAIVYILLVGRRLLPGKAESDNASRPERSIFELWEEFGISSNVVALRIGADSPLVGHTIAEIELHSRFDVWLTGLRRRHRHGADRIAVPAATTVFQAQDIILVIGEEENHDRFISEFGLQRTPITDRERQLWLWELGGASVLIHPESRLIGKSLRESRFRSTYGLHVLGVRHANRPVEDFEKVELSASDSLFVAGPWPCIDELQATARDFVVMEMPRERGDVVGEYRKMPIALIILVAMVALTLFNVVPLVVAVIMAALAAVFTRCLTMADAYRSIHWSSIVLLAGMLPLADALDKTGGTDLIVSKMMATVGDSGPYAMLSVIFALTALLSTVLSNTATAVLVAPIAIYIARALDVSPYPFAVAVVIAASAAYSTPVSSPVVTLIVEPGRYKFMDFVKLGVPLLVLTYLVAVLLIPMIFPFDGFQWPVDAAVEMTTP